MGLPKAVWSASSEGALVRRELGGVRPLGDRQEKMPLNRWTSEGIINCLGLTMWFQEITEAM